MRRLEGRVGSESDLEYYANYNLNYGVITMTPFYYSRCNGLDRKDNQTG